jgi:hypothetical protein
MTKQDLVAKNEELLQQNARLRVKLEVSKQLFAMIKELLSKASEQKSEGDNGSGTGPQDNS